MCTSREKKMYNSMLLLKMMESTQVQTFFSSSTTKVPSFSLSLSGNAMDSLYLYWNVIGKPIEERLVVQVEVVLYAWWGWGLGRVQKSLGCLIGVVGHKQGLSSCCSCTTGNVFANGSSAVSLLKNQKIHALTIMLTPLLNQVFKPHSFLTEVEHRTHGSRMGWSED